MVKERVSDQIQGLYQSSRRNEKKPKVTKDLFVVTMQVEAITTDSSFHSEDMPEASADAKNS